MESVIANPKLCRKLSLQRDRYNKRTLHGVILWALPCMVMAMIREDAMTSVGPLLMRIGVEL